MLDMTRLRSRRAVVRYDAAGHGDSESTDDLVRYHWRELALDQLALANQLRIDRYIAGGASMGSATALHAAVFAPERIAALVLMIPPTAWETRAAQQQNYETMAALVESGQHELLIAGARATPPRPVREQAGGSTGSRRCSLRPTRGAWPGCSGERRRPTSRTEPPSAGSRLRR
ncbi:MAG: alpha/beta fold hydrolase [Ilumatobacteraceae bacterium]